MPGYRACGVGGPELPALALMGHTGGISLGGGQLAAAHGREGRGETLAVLLILCFSRRAKFSPPCFASFLFCFSHLLLSRVRGSGQHLTPG